MSRAAALSFRVDPSAVTPEEGAPALDRLIFGSAMVIRPGFSCTWDAVETTLKDS